MRSKKSNIVISKTIEFIFVVLFIIVFQKVFGKDNTLVGVTTITMALMFLDRDLTKRKWEYLIEFILINVGIGVFTHIAYINPFIGIGLNFIGMFFIGYVFSYDIRSHMYVAFGLQYVFLLTTPVSEGRLYMRILSLVFGAVFVMILQLLFNRNKVQKTGVSKLKIIIGLLIEKIDINDNNTSNKKLKEVSNEIKATVYNSRFKYFHIESTGKYLIETLAIIKMLSKDIENTKNLDDLKNILIDIEKNFHNKERLKEINFKILEYKINSKEIGLISNIISLIIKINTVEEENFDFNIPKEFERKNIIKRFLNKNSMRFRYAMRLGICIALVEFISSYFNLFQGRWMVYTAFAIIQPYKEYGISKVKQRCTGTLIGGIIFFILFTLVNNPIMQSTMIILSGYIDCFSKSYKRKMICVSVSAIGNSLIASSGPLHIMLTRIIFICLGGAIAVLFNKYILPYSIKDAKRDLINMYDCNIDRMIEEIKKDKDNGILENLYIIASMIENKLTEFDKNIRLDNSLGKKIKKVEIEYVQKINEKNNIMI